MSYSSETKEELCRFEPDSVCCLLAQGAGGPVGEADGFSAGHGWLHG